MNIITVWSIYTEAWHKNSSHNVCFKIQLIPSNPTTVHDIVGSRCACHITTAVPTANAADSTGVRLQAASWDDLCRRGGREGCVQGNTQFLQNILRLIPKTAKSDSSHSHVCHPVCTEELGSLWVDVCGIWYCRTFFFWKYVEKT